MRDRVRNAGGLAAALALVAGAATAQTATMQMQGVARAMASVELSATQIELPTDLSGPYSGPLFSFTDRGTARNGYILSLDVRSAKTHGGPALDNGRGQAIPYQLFYGESEVRFVRGAARLNEAAASAMSSRKHTVSIRTPPARPLEGVLYQDLIRLTVAAR